MDHTQNFGGGGTRADSFFVLFAESRRKVRARHMADALPVEGILFDLDGTLIDFEGASHVALSRPLEARGRSLSWDAHARIVGTKQEDWSRAILEAEGLAAELPAERYVAEYHEIVGGLYPKIPAWPGTAPLLDALRAAGFPMAIATSSPRPAFERKMVHHAPILAKMSAVVTGDEVACGKPAPDIFLEAARRLGCDPARCVVFEDSPAGIAAAHAAGCAAVALPDARMPSNTPRFAELAPRWLLTDGIGSFDPSCIRPVAPSRRWSAP
jgi:pseudouridine-5'-monophosphatase